MTCIVGWANDEIMVVGGDSAGVSGYDITTRSDPKVFKVKQKNGEDAIIGFTSSFRMGQLLMFVEIPEDPSDRKDKGAHFFFLVKEFIPVVRGLFKDGGFSVVNSHKESGGEFILAYRGSIYVIQSDFQVSAPSMPFDAIGCGEAYAKGALHLACMASNTIDISKIVLSALLVSEKCSAGVRSPMNIIEIRTPNNEPPKIIPSSPKMNSTRKQKTAV